MTYRTYKTYVISYGAKLYNDPWGDWSFQYARKEEWAHKEHIEKLLEKKMA